MNRLTPLLRPLMILVLMTSCGAPEESASPSASDAAISANLSKPPMGWNSWNTFAEAIDFNVIKAQADAMVSSGMKDAGYEYVNLDAGWWLGTRDSQGNITVDSAKWPGGMKAIADYIHSKGLKAGIYTDAGKNGCIYWWPTNGPPGPGTGSEGHYDRDFLQFSQWGFDYVKVDWCGGRDEGLNARSSYTAISAAIDRASAQTGRQMVLSICEWGANQPWNWAPALSSLWRTSDDIIFFGERPSMDRVLRNFDSALHPEAQSPGHYNDPDMLMVGMPGFTASQNRTHMGLWAILSAPLIAGNNLATMSAETRGILTNRDVLSIHADPLARTPTKVSEATTGRQVYSKVLSGTGRRAVALLNRTTSAGSITVRWSDLGLTAGSARVKDVWTGQDLGMIATSHTVTVPAREAVLLLVTESSEVVEGPVSINAGGAASGAFVADANFSGGSTYSVTTAIDTSQLSGTIPSQAVLQTERYGEFTYTIPGLTAGSPYAVTLYFDEVYWTAAGQRTFDVAINGATVLSAFDIFAAAGGTAKAISQTFDTTADASGQVVIRFTKGGGPDNPKVCAITVAAAGPSTKYPLTVQKAGTGAGTVAGASIDCGSACSASFESGTTVTLTATAATGSTFGGWSGACTGTSATCSVSMTAARTATATFTATPSTTCRTPVANGQSGNFDTTGAVCYTVNATVHGWGCSNVDGRSVTVNGTAVTCGKMPLPGSAPYTLSFTAGAYPWASFYWW